MCLWVLTYKKQAMKGGHGGLECRERIHGRMDGIEEGNRMEGVDGEGEGRGWKRVMR